MKINRFLKYTVIFLLLIILFYLITFRKKEVNNQFPEIPESFSDWSAKEPVRFYNGDEIFHFINGEGVIYLEYDFKVVAVQQYFSSNKNIELAVYNMGKPEDAFGIFSLYSQDEGSPLGIGNDDRTTDFSIKFWKDKYFVNITTYNMSTRDDIISIAKIIDKNIINTGKYPEILKYFTKSEQNNLSYFHGKSSLNSIYHINDKNILQLNTDTEGVICSYPENNMKILLIKYPDEKSAQNILKSMKDSIKNGTIELKDNFLIWKRAEKSFDIFTQNNNYLTGVLNKNTDSNKDLLKFLDNLQ